jgi:hypothetical protein
MSFSQSNPAGYPSALYPATSAISNEQILPKIVDASLSGNAADYQSNKVGGRRQSRRSHLSRRSSKRGKHYRRKRTQKRKRN